GDHPIAAPVNYFIDKKIQPCHTVASPATAAAHPISRNRGSSSWQTPLSSCCHTTLEVFVGCSRPLSVAASCSTPLVASAALLDNCCLYAHDLFWTLRLSLRVQSRELVGPREGPELTTVASVEIPKPSSGSPIGISSLLQRAVLPLSGDNLELSDAVLKLPVFIPLSKSASIVRCVEPSPSVSESLDLILVGAQNLVALIGSVGQKMLAVADFCWLA
ncbi:hypothetical protein BHE74_00053136, partial [Ensete ventricosum]